MMYAGFKCGTPLSVINYRGDIGDLNLLRPSILLKHEKLPSCSSLGLSFYFVYTLYSKQNLTQYSRETIILVLK